MSIGQNFKFTGNVLTVAGWTVNSDTITGGNATLAAAGYLSLGTGTDGYAQSTTRIYIDGVNSRMSIGTGFKYTGGTLTIDGNATIGGWDIGSSLTATNMRLIPGDAIELGSATAIDSGDGVWIGNNGYARFGNPSGNELKYDGTNVFVGNDAAEHIKIDGTSMLFKSDGSNVEAEIRSGTLTLGGAHGTTADTVVLDGSSVTIYGNNDQTGVFITDDQIAIKSDGDNDKLTLTDDGMTVTAGGQTVGSFGSTVQVGQNQNNQGRVLLDGLSMDFIFKQSGTDVSRAEFGSIVRIGNKLGEHISASDAGIFIKDGTSQLGKFNAAGLTIGSTSNAHISASTTDVSIIEDATHKVRVASDGFYVHSGHANRSAKFTDEISLYGGSDFSVRTLHITDDGINIGKGATGPSSDGNPNPVIGNVSLHSGGARIYGATVNDYVDVKSAGVDIVASTVTQASFGATTTIGTSTDKVTLSSSGITIRENDIDTIDLSGGSVVVGEVDTGKSNVQITSGAVNLRNNTTNKMTLAADGSITIGSDFSVASGGDVTMTGTITANAGSIGGFKLGSSNIFGNLTGNNAATESNFQIFTSKTGPYIAMRRGFFDDPSYPGGKILMGRNLATDATSVPHTFDGERIVMDGEDTSLKYFSGSGAPDASNPHYPRKFKLGSDLYSETGLATILENRAGNYINGLPGLMLTSGSIVVDNTAGMPNGDDTGAGWLPPFMVLTRAHNQFARGAHFAMKRDVRKQEGTAFGGSLVYRTPWDVTSVYHEGLNGDYRNTANFILTLSGSNKAYQGDSTTTFDEYDNYNLYSEVILGSADPTKMYSGYFKNARFYVGGTESMFNMTGTFSVTSSNLTVDGDGTVTATAFSGTSATLTGTVQAEQITTTDDITLPATGKLYLDGGSHTYIHEVSSDKMDFVVGGDTILELCETSLASTSYAAIQATNKFYLDGGSNTFIQETAGDRIEIVAGGYALMSIKENTTSSRTIIYRDLIINGENNVAGSGDTEDGDSLRLHNNGSDSYIDFDGGSLNIRDDETTVMSIADSLGAVEFGATNKGANSAVRVLAGDAYEAGFEAYGSSQGTGYVYTGQSTTFGGGMFYNGNSSPQFSADEFGSDYLSFFRRSSGTDNTVFGFHYNADTVYFAGDVIAFYSSDERLKENVIPIGNAIEKVKQIRGVEFDWIPTELSDGEDVHTNEGHDVGVIAQEIEKVLPEAVTTRDSGYKAVKYEKIVPLLIESIKEQQEQIDELKKEIKELKDA